MPSRDQRSTVTPRIEPQLGSLDAPKPVPPPADGLPHFRAEPRTPRAARRAPEHAPRAASRHLGAAAPRWRLWLLLAVLLLSGTLLVAQHRDWFAQLLPTPQLDHLLDQGDRALAQGQLEAARGYYMQAATISGDNGRAQNGLQAVGQAELARARAALAAHRLEAAGQALQQARALLGGGMALQTLEQQLARQRARGVELSDLVTRARQAFAAGNLDGARGAASLYQQMLQIDPGNAVARHGLDRVGAALAQQVRVSLDNGDLHAAQQQIRRLAGLLPAQADLPELSADLASRERAAAQADTQTLHAAARLLAQGHITTPPTRNALLLYQQVLASDPGNTQAQAGLARVATALIVQAHAQTDAGDFSAARALLDQAATLTPHSAELAAALARLARARQQHQAQPQVPSAQRAQAQALVQRAQAAAARGDFLTPPGSSAFDLYRQALALDGESRAANDGLRALPQQAEQAAGQALRAGRLHHAGDLLQSYAQLAPGAAGVDALRQQLGAAWLHLANRDLARGNRGAARQALAQAQRWVPSDPRVQALAQGLGGA